MVHPIDVAVKSIPVGADVKIELAENDVRARERPGNVSADDDDDATYRVGERQQERVVVEGRQSIAIEENADVSHHAQLDV